MDMLPEFAILMRRAIADHSTQLEGLRLKSDWMMAHEAVRWMVELAKTSPAVTPPGHLLPEHILDAQFPIWRMWARWKPNTARVQVMQRKSVQGLSLLPDFTALEGPDMITGTQATLREGLIAQYCGKKRLLRWRGLVIELLDDTKQNLSKLLDRLMMAVDALSSASSATHASISELFWYLFVGQLISHDGLDLFEATAKISYYPDNNVYKSVQEIHSNRHQLGGKQILALQTLLKVFDDQNSDDLRNLLLQDWLRHGLETCLRDCQEAVVAQIDKGQEWTQLALEYHTFCSALMALEHRWPTEKQTMRIPQSWPSREDLDDVVAIYKAAHAHRPNRAREAPEEQTPVSNPADEKTSHPLEEHIEAYCIDRLLQSKSMSHSSRRTVASILHVWECTRQSDMDVGRRELAILISRVDGMDLILRSRCLSEIATGKDMRPPGALVKSLLTIVRLSESDTTKAIVAMCSSLVETNSPTICWRDLLYLWLDKKRGSAKDVLEYSLQTMPVMAWLRFMQNIEMLCDPASISVTPRRSMPGVLQSALLSWKSQILQYAGTLMRLENELGAGSGPLRCLLTCHDWKRGNQVEIKDCILHLARATPEAVDTCIRIWDAKNYGQLHLPGSASAIASIAGVLGICATPCSPSAWNSKLTEAMTFWEAIENEIINEAMRLEKLQKALKLRDPKGTACLLKELGVPDESLLDEEMMSLPASISSLVERVGENEVEVSFPISAITQLQRGAMGIPASAQSFLLRLSIPNIDNSPASFCIHFNTERDLDNLQHTPWVCSSDSRAPWENFCTTPQTAFVWQLNRIVHTQLRTSNLGIAKLHQLVTQQTAELARSCIACGTSHNANNAHLRRSTPCNVLGCTRLWYQLPLEVRVPELKTDTFAVDAMLTSVYAAAMSG
ncbi:hypothetical protein EK21DRAFT_26345, partial [Setomelanomma holmii]